MYRRTWRRGRPSIYASYVIARAIEDPWRLWSMRELGEDIFNEMIESGEDMRDRTHRHVIDALNRRRVHYRPDEDTALPECGDETVLIREKGMRIETSAWYAWRWALSYEEQHWGDETNLAIVRGIRDNFLLNREQVKGSATRKAVFDSGIHTFEEQGVDQTLIPLQSKISTVRVRNQILTRLVLTAIQIGTASLFLLSPRHPLRVFDHTGDAELWADSLTAEAVVIHQLGKREGAIREYVPPGSQPPPRIIVDRGQLPPPLSSWGGSLVGGGSD